MTADRYGQLDDLGRVADGSDTEYARRYQANLALYAETVGGVPAAVCSKCAAITIDPDRWDTCVADGKVYCDRCWPTDGDSRCSACGGDLDGSGHRHGCGNDPDHAFCSTHGAALCVEDAVAGQIISVVIEGWTCEITVADIVADDPTSVTVWGDVRKLSYDGAAGGYGWVDTARRYVVVAHHAPVRLLDRPTLVVCDVCRQMAPCSTHGWLHARIRERG